MRDYGLVIALILALVAITPFTLSQFAGSQSFTSLTLVQKFTSTVVTAFTSSLTSTMTAPQNVRYDLTPHDFNNKTGSFTLRYEEMGTAPYYPAGYLCLMYDYFLLNATTAYEFKIHFETQQGIPIHFLILNADQFNQFNHSNGCTFGPFGWELRVVAPASDQVWVVPQSGEYVLLFLSRQFVGGSIYLSVQAYGQVIQTSTSVHLTTSTIELVSTQTTTSTLPYVSATTTMTNTNNSPLIVVAIIIGLVLVGGAVILRMKRHAESS